MASQQIPKTIHCFLLGDYDKNKFKKSKYYQSWQKYSQGYQIKIWDNSNLAKGQELDIRKMPDYVKEAYRQKRWAFVSDYLRLKVLHDYGGIYLDTDVELKKSLEKIRQSNQGFFGFDCDGKQVGTACFGVVKESEIIKEIMDLYQKLDFGTPEDPFLLANTFIYTSIFLKRGLQQNNKTQNIGGITIFPKEYFCATLPPMLKRSPLVRLLYRAKTFYYQIVCRQFAKHDFQMSWIKGRREYYLKNEQKWVDQINKIMDTNMKSNF